MTNQQSPNKKIQVKNNTSACEEQHNKPYKSESPLRPLGIFGVIWSVVAAMFGVRDHEKHERDFSEGNLVQFVAVGVVFVFVFVISLIWIVLHILERSIG